jgi:hypothetical protein
VVSRSEHQEEGSQRTDEPEGRKTLKALSVRTVSLLSDGQDIDEANEISLKIRINYKTLLLLFSALVGAQRVSELIFR